MEVSFEPIACTPPPLPRSGACAASTATDVLMVGGYTEDSNKQRQCTNEVLAFSPAAPGWRPVPAHSATPLPPPRLVAQAVIPPDSDKLWLIGGWNANVQGPEAFLGDVWQLDLASHAWTQVQPAGEQLQGISRFQATADGSRIFIHTHRTLDSILVMDTAASPPRLESLAVTGDAPSSRGLHSMVRVGRALFVFGGAPQKGPMLNDSYRLDLESMHWERLQPSGTTPHARCSAAAAAVGDRYIVFFGGAFYSGGDSGPLQMLDDVAVLDTHAMAWLDVTVQGQRPLPRNAAVMVPLPQGAAAVAADAGKLLLQGGWKAFDKTYDDSFVVSVKPL